LLRCKTPSELGPPPGRLPTNVPIDSRFCFPHRTRDALT
jgi:hypothetical protein